MIIVPSTSSNKVKQREDEEKKKMKDRVKEFVFPRVLLFLSYRNIII